VELAKDNEHGAGLEFRDFRNANIKEWRQMKLKMRADLGMKLHAMTLGKDPEEFVKEQKKKS
jgi:hypothetical protein